MTVRISKTKEAVKGTGSFKVTYHGGVRFFYYEDIPGRRLRSEQVDQETAKKQAQEFAKAEQDKIKD